MKIEANNLVVRYGEKRAVDHISFTAEPGEVMIFIGRNGSGKSSLLKGIMGIVPLKGNLQFDGSPTRQKSIGYMPQDNATWAVLSVFETVLLGLQARLGLAVSEADIARVASILKLFRLESLAERDLGTLSGGQRQMVYLAQALVNDPSILLLDEPLSALDVCHQLEVMETIRAITRERALVTIMILHDLVIAARYADRIAILQDGKLAALGLPKDVLTIENLANAFNIHAKIIKGEGEELYIFPQRAIPAPIPPQLNRSSIAL